MGFAQIARTVGLPRTFLFSCLAGCEGTLQADRVGGRLGHHPTPIHSSHIQFVFWTPCQDAVRWYSLPAVFVHRARALDVFFLRAEPVVEQSCREREFDHQGVLPAARSADLFCSSRRGGFFARVLCFAGDDVVLSRLPYPEYRV